MFTRVARPLSTSLRRFSPVPSPICSRPRPLHIALPRRQATTNKTKGATDILVDKNDATPTSASGAAGSTSSSMTASPSSSQSAMSSPADTFGDITPFNSPLTSILNSFFRDPFFGSFTRMDPIINAAFEPLRDPTLINFFQELSKPVRVDVDEDHHQYTMTLSLPGGANKEDLHVKVEPNGMLHVWGKTESRRDRDRDRGQRGRKIINFERWVALPDTADKEKINAKYDNGKLIVTIPKTDRAKAEEKKGEVNIQ